MVAWSSVCLKNINRGSLLRSLVGKYNNAYQSKGVNLVQFRASSHRTFEIRPSQFVYAKFKDLVNFYLLLGIIPLTCVAVYVNLFIGPAKLALIPEGYEPKYYEYFEHPISRFFAKYLIQTPQERYERTLHQIFRDYEEKQVFLIKKKVKNLMKERLDYQAWYYIPAVTQKYMRLEKEKIDEYMENRAGRTQGILRTTS